MNISSQASLPFQGLFSPLPGVVARTIALLDGFPAKVAPYRPVC
ncbi:hypothetical protein [Endozoicomonas sp. ONNA1]|nr:hypothetical protein [Endozoicomonas sp. ONNA1]